MPRDKRLYMTFPIDFHRHPKLARLPVDVRWAFVEMNGEARIADNDGMFEAEEAEFLWGRDVLDQLVGSHPSRPLVERVNGGYQIREFAEHQQTRADREARSATNSENGRKGGRPRKNRTETESVTTGNRTEPTETQSQSQSQSQSKSQRTDSITDQSSSTSRAKTPAEDRSGESPVDKRIAAVRDAVSAKLGVELHPIAALVLVERFEKRAPDNVRSMPAYLKRCIDNEDEFELQKLIHDQALA